MSEYCEFRLEILHDSGCHCDENWIGSKEYEKHLEETGLTADVWEIVINGEHKICGVVPYEYALQLAYEYMKENHTVNREKPNE